jgi:hypothetical protein
MTLMKGLVKPDSGREGGEEVGKSNGSALAIVGGDETEETCRGRMLAERRSVPSNRSDACPVNGRCSERTGQNLQVVTGTG